MMKSVTYLLLLSTTRHMSTTQRFLPLAPIAYACLLILNNIIVSYRSDLVFIKNFSGGLFGFFFFSFIFIASLSIVGFLKKLVFNVI